MKFKTITSPDVDELKELAQILLVTATDVETSALHDCLRPLPGRTQCLTMTDGNQTYFVGRLGGYGVIHVQCCQMGSVLPGASASTVAEAIAHWGVRAVVMTGIAFGVDRIKQRIGDILVSKMVIPYEVKRVGKGKVSPRGPIPPSRSVLLNRFSNGRQWDYPLARDKRARLIPTPLLSGESLIDDENYRTKLLKTFPQAEGGEMEGTGVFAAAHQKNIEWILVKGICDFADGKKSRGKKANQHTAAAAAVSLCSHVFSQPGAFDDLGCVDLTHGVRKQTGNRLSLDEVLFEVYDRAYERAYLERSIDKEISAVLEHQGLWISGPSGSGKTNALMRNLSTAGKSYEFIDLSMCVGVTVPELFKCLHEEIAERLKIPVANRTASLKRNGLSFHIGQIAKLLESNVNEETRFLIDEVPLDGAGFGAFSEGIAAILITLVNRNFHKAHFLLATIINPKSALTRVQAKLHERMRLLHIPLWTETEMNSLIKLVAGLFPLHLSKPEKAKIVKAANGCPRSMKIMLRNWCMFRNTPGWTLDRVISETPGHAVS